MSSLERKVSRWSASGDTIALTLEVGEGRRRDHDDDKVTEPVEDRRNCIRVDASAQVRELSW
jgi:hypothetical protein